MAETNQTTSLSQYLTFNMASEKYGVDVTNVRNILENTSITKLPKTPGFLLGVLNDRGGVLPVVDLRLKFGMPKGETTIDTCVIVVETAFDTQAIFIGVLVDSVEEVIDLEVENIEPPPRIGTGLNIDFIQGMGKRGEQFITLLNIAKVFSDDDRTQLETASHEQDAVPTGA